MDVHVTAPALLQRCYDRLDRITPAPAVVLGPPPAGPGWIGAAELTPGSGAVDRLVAVDAAHGRAAYGVPLRPDVAATFCLHRYAWPLTLLVGLPWLLDGRVPRLPVQDVAVNRGENRWSLRIRTFACLPDDPAARTPGARVVPDGDALRAELRAAVAEHLAPVLEAFRPRMRRGSRTLWGMVTDELAESLRYAARTLGGAAGETDASAALNALLPGGTPPLAGAAGFRAAGGAAPRQAAAPTDTRAGGGAAERAGGRGPDEAVTRTRISCCLYYTVDPEAPCATCPRRLRPAAGPRRG